MTGGVAALMGCFILGPRLGRFRADGTVRFHCFPRAPSALHHACFAAASGPCIAQERIPFGHQMQIQEA